jgi:hypothetical protein
MTMDALRKLENIVAALNEQADESPFTREEWDRVDKQTAESNREVCGLLAQLAAAEERHRQDLETVHQGYEYQKDRAQQAEERAERAQKDAARYRWLRDSHPTDQTVWVARGTPGSPSGISCWRRESLDRYIDAAIGDAKSPPV